MPTDAQITEDITSNTENQISGRNAYNAAEDAVTTEAILAAALMISKVFTSSDPSEKKLAEEAASLIAPKIRTDMQQAKDLIQPILDHIKSREEEAKAARLAAFRLSPTAAATSAAATSAAAAAAETYTIQTNHTTPSFKPNTLRTPNAVQNALAGGSAQGGRG